MVDIVEIVRADVMVDIGDIVGIIDTVDSVDAVEAIWNNARLCYNQSQKRKSINQSPSWL